MSKFAIIRTGGKQYKVTEGDTVLVDKLETESGKSIDIKDVLLVSDGKDVKVGAPNVEGVVVTAEVSEHVKGPKIDGLKFKAKSRYRRRYGHRQDLTKLVIKKIK